mgnify:CR=1 FL=1
MCCWPSTVGLQLFAFNCSPSTVCPELTPDYVQPVDVVVTQHDQRADAVPWRGGLNDYACPSTAMTTWLNRKDVRAALNIQPDNRFNSADNGVGMNYTLVRTVCLEVVLNCRPYYALFALKLILCLSLTLVFAVKKWF